MKELEITFKVRNNLIKKRRTQLGLSARGCALAMGVAYQTLLKYESLQLGPYRRDGSWRLSAIKIAAYFGEAPGKLWPESVLAIQRSTATIETDAPSLTRLVDTDVRRLPAPVEANPEEMAMLASTSSYVRRGLSTLSERDVEVLGMRFGLNGDEPMTREEISVVLKKSRERVRQIERRALERLCDALQKIAPVHNEGDGVTWDVEEPVTAYIRNMRNDALEKAIERVKKEAGL